LVVVGEGRKKGRIAEKGEGRVSNRAGTDRDSSLKIHAEKGESTEGRLRTREMDRSEEKGRKDERRGKRARECCTGNVSGGVKGESKRKTEYS